MFTDSSTKISTTSSSPIYLEESPTIKDLTTGKINPKFNLKVASPYSDIIVYLKASTEGNSKPMPQD
jgi:hypothetical protein